QALRVGGPGGTSVQDWWPDGSGLLLVNGFEGRDRLLRYDLATADVEVIPTEPGVVQKARVRPDGGVWYLHEQGPRAGRILDGEEREVISLQGATAPDSRPYHSWHF